MASTYEFDLVIGRTITDDEVDALWESGCDDAMPEVGTLKTVVHFNREAPTLVQAITSAVEGVERAGLPVDGVGSGDLVDVSEIAVRTGRSRESIRLLAIGKRGPGGFPSPISAFYSWAAVCDWFVKYDPKAVGAPEADQLEYDLLIAAADLVVRARTLTRGHAQGLEALLSA